MATFTRKQVSASAGATLSTNPASPTSLAASASGTATFVWSALNTGDAIASADLVGTVIIGSSAPTTNPTIQFAYTFDGTNYAVDQTVSVPLTTATTFPFTYRPPRSAIAAQVTVTNGATNGITAWAECNTTSVN